MPKLFAAPSPNQTTTRIFGAIAHCAMRRADQWRGGFVVALLACAATAGLWLTTAAPAQAEEPYRWCAEYSGSEGSDGVNCGFDTLAQCRATISGIGGNCYENPAYPAPRPKPKKRNVR